MAALISLLYRFCLSPVSWLKLSGNSNSLKKNIIYPANGLLIQGNNTKERSILKTFPVKAIVFAITFVVVNLFFLSTAFANKRVTGVVYGTQTGTATFGTGTSSITYTITLSETGAAAPAADDISLTWASGTPTGVTYAFSSSTETPITNTTFFPSGGNGSIITLTITTSNSTPAGTDGFTIKITDNNAGGGPYSSAGLSLLVSAPANTIGYTGSPFTFYQGSAISSLTPTVTGSPTSYSISPALPAGLAFSTTTGIISGTPTATAAAANYTITANYSVGAPATTTINITVLAPTISYAGSPFTYYTGTAISSLTPVVTGTPTSYSISPALSAGLAFSTVTGVISGTPTAIAAAANYTITANYAGGVTATAVINITVAAPTISYTGSPFTYYTGTAIASLTPTVTGSPVSYAISPALSAGLAFSTATGVISGTPTALAAAANYTITATYTGGVTATTSVNITVVAPTISYTGSPFTFYRGSAIISLIPTVTGTPVSYAIAPALSAGLALSTTTGVISGTPTALAAAANYTITATYTGGVTATTIINITVLAPTISYTGSPFTFYRGSTITSLTPTVTGTPVSYAIAPALPAGLALSTTTGVISGTPTALAAAANYTVTATYAGAVTATTIINITVLAPTISYTGSPFTFYRGSAITSLTPTVTGTPISYAIAPALPAGLALSTTTGVISGTPTVLAAAANYTITATYAGAVTATTIINITVLAPTISYIGSPFTYYKGTAIASLTPTVTGSPTGYTIGPALPAGLSIDPVLGVISGTPTVTAAAANYTITATYTGGVTATTIINITVLAPTISYGGSPFTYYKGTAIASLTPTVTGSPTGYSIGPALPAGLSIDPVLGVISGTPTATAAAANYTVTAAYTGGVTATTIINITVLAPTINYTGSPFTYVTGTTIASLTPTVTGSPTGYSVSPGLPAGLSIDPVLGIISGTPTAVTANATYTITATYAGGVTATTAITMKVNIAPPVISYSPSTNIYVVGTAITPLTPANTGGAAASYSIGATLPAGLAFNTATGVISGTPTAAALIATYTITATNAGGIGSTIVTLTVNPKPPVISYVPSANVYTVGTTITSLTPVNTGGAAASYSISTPLPAGMLFNTTTGVISGTPTVISTITTYTITATNAGGTGSTTETITVNPPAPVVHYTPSTNVFIVGTAITPMTPINTGGAATGYIIGPALPAGLSFNTTTGVISGTPTVVSPVTNYVISASNDGGISTTTVTLSCILPVPPVISYTPSTNIYTVGTTITSLTPVNTGGTPSGYSISSALPAGLSFNTITGVIFGTPTAASPITTYTITATNSAGSGSTTVTLTVNPVSPTISYTPSTNVYTQGTPITPLTPVNTGGTVSSYSISTALPAGLSFNTATGVISGTPTALSPVTTYTITAVNTGGTATTTVTLSVTHIAPVITYSPGTVTYAVGGTITPAVPINTGGAAASYSITGTLPTGLSFNTSTGVISGTPTFVFPTATFTITATNTAGTSSTSLIITVSPAAPIISYTPSTNSYPVGAPIATLAPVNTGGAVVGYSYSSTGTLLTGATLSGPSLMTIDASGNIYVANYNNGTVSRWNSSHTYLGTYETGKTMANPEGIVFDSAGNSYVEDTGNGAIYKFNAAGVYQSTIITGLNHPLGISIDASDNLYIATYVYTSPYTSSVTKYSTSGTLLQTLPNTNMNESDGVAVDQSSGVIYVLNRGNNLAGTNMGTVTEYSAAGAYLGVFSSGYNDPLAISVDPSGNVFVADSHNNEVKIYSSNGVLLNTLTGFTDVEGFVADASGNLYVSDFTNNTVKEFLSLGGYHISGPLPPGLSFNSTNGQITGTPTGVFPVTTYTITAYNITGSGTTTVTLSCYDSDDWIGVTSTDWNTPSNWLSGIVPTSVSQALIGVNRAFSYFPNVLTSDGTVNVGSIAFGNLGGQAPGVNVNSGATLNVLGAITYQSDASAGLGYTTTLLGGGTLNTNSISIIANTNLAGSYTATMASSVTNLNVTANISLTSSNSGAALYNSTFNITGGTTLLSGILQTTNTAASTSSFIIAPATTATLQLAGATALSALSATGTNVVTFNNTGATVQYSGAAQTVYTDAGITGLPAGVSYNNIAFSGTGISTALTGNLNITGNFTNTMVNDAADLVNFANPTVNFIGTTQNLAGGPGNGTTLYNVTFSGAGTKTMSSGNFYVASSGVLTMSGNNPLTVLAANGLLTLNSAPTGSASVAAIQTGGPRITGNVNVQRYITGGVGYRTYRLESSPVYAATVGSSNVYSINYLQNSIYLTGTSGTINGFDKAGNPTLYLYREDQIPSNATFTSGNFWGISAINNTPAYTYSAVGLSASGNFNIPVGNGLFFFFRGNRAAAPLATETTTSFTSAPTVTLTATGTLNQGQVTVSDWYTPASAYLGYTGAGVGTNFAVRGFNLVGNPYASTIDWELFNTTSTTTGIYGHNVGTTIYEMDPATENYDVYQLGGVYTNHGRRTIASGQGFFVLATSNASPQLIFNESAKTTAQNTGLNLMMALKTNLFAANTSSANVDQHLRLQMAMDSVNTDDVYIGFNSASSAQFVDNEDAPYRRGNGKVKMASYSTDNVPLAINKMPLPGLKQATIPLFVTANAHGTYKLNMTELQDIPKIYEIWLMDSFNKDSLDMRHNTTYAFDITADTNSYGTKRFQLVIRQNPALALHLLDFTAAKATNGAQVTWKTENEENYTNFTVERSTNNGVTFDLLGSIASSDKGTYGFLDPKPAIAADQYRLKLVDLSGNITYSNIVTLMYANSNSLAKGNINIYPNPAVGTLNLTITPPFSSGSTAGLITSSTGSTPVPAGSTVYGIKIVNNTGSVLRTASTNQQDWQTDISSLMPGTYILQVINTHDNSVIGTSTFVKL